MEKEILLENKKVVYAFRRSARARRMRVTVSCGGAVVVTAPAGWQESAVEQFLQEKAAWLLAKISFFRQFKPLLVPRGGRREYLKHKEAACRLAGERVAHWNQFYGFNFKRINIKNQKSRWGSCSKKGNLNFNYKIVLLPPALADYVVVHELCHLGEFNHSRRFWESVARVIPNYAKLRRELRLSL
jgi:hypothetical protein